LTPERDRSCHIGSLASAGMLLGSVCALCGRRGDVVCAGCGAGLGRAPSLVVPLGLDGCAALLDYSDARSLVTSLKNGGRRDLVGWLADQMADLLDPPPSGVVTWAPTGAPRRRARGYDQAELLARAVARRWALPCGRLLRRAPGPAQAGRTAGERRHNPSFDAVRPCDGVVVLVDDVTTTGATLTAAARALRAGGSTRVLALVAARSLGRRAA
jgi:predicted amidophosphoribosyltransferase